MKRGAPFLLATALLVLLSGCVTHLRVSTEVYDGPLPPDPLPATAATLGALAETKLTGYGSRASDEAADTFVKVIGELQKDGSRPGSPNIFGDKDSLPAFRASFKAAANDMLQPAMRSAAAARSLAQQLKAICPQPDSAACGKGVTDDALPQLWIRTLRERVAETVRLGRDAIEEIDSGEIAEYRHAMRVNASKLPDDQLAAATGRKKIKDDTDRSNAKAQLSAQWIARADAITRNLRAEGDTQLQELLVEPALSLTETLVSTQIIPLHDPAVRMILAQTELNQAVWKKYVNDVESFNQFGNAEIAFRMDGLGDTHIKGVLFDSSQAMKTGFSVLAKTVEATASAYGGAVFAAKPANSQGGGTDTAGADTGATKAGAVAAAQSSSKPAIDAEVARLDSSASMRREAMESLFWQLTALGKGLPADGTDDAADAKKLIALVQCAQNELTDPQGRRCGGE